MDLSSLSGAVIAFDLDGTLVETAPDLVGTLNALLEEEGLPALPMAEARTLIGKGAKALVQRGFDAAGEHLGEARAEQLFQRFLAHYLGRIAHESAPFPGCLEALETLRAAGATLCVCTNKRTDLSLALLDALDMTKLFAAVVGPDAAGAAKPDARHLLHAVNACGGDIARTVMVGDAATDAGAARNAGAALVLVDFGYTEVPAAELGADILISHFDALPGACARLLAACEPANAKL